MPGGAIWEGKICAEGSQSATDEAEKMTKQGGNAGKIF